MNFLDLTTVVLALGVALLVVGVLAPFEALGWCAGWFVSDTGVEDTAVIPDALTETKNAIDDAVEAPHFVVFLSGIHSVSGESYAPREIAFLHALRERMPHITLVELFPYSVTNRALTGQRAFAKVWRWALRNKISGNGFAGFLINFRNLWQVAVSADSRYGPIYNQGSAEMILRGLKANGYTLGSHAPITLIGYSGGGQIAVGAAPYLRQVIGQPVQVISLGGVLSSDPGVLEVTKLYHLFGKRDMVQRVGQIMCPGRWRLLPFSPWNQALRYGLIERVPMGNMDHTGVDGYLDGELREGEPTYLDVTLDTVTHLLAEVEQRVGAVPSPS
jgi:hypothetical protein